MLSFFQLNAQIIIDNTAPYDNPTWLVDNVLLGGGITTSNHSYQGDSVQIGWFDATNTNLGINSGIVMCTGDIYELDPNVVPGFVGVQNTVTDPDLLTVANSVPGMIGQTFNVTSINNVAILEFDFIPTSDSLKFKYVFGSQEYFTFENTQYNDVFGFFLSGPGIAGPWANGAINLAVVPNTNPPLPITISTIHNGQNGAIASINQQYFVPNQGTGLDTIASADGFTTVLTARALVQCGQTYHIKLAIADGSDQGLSSYVWLDGGSFFSPSLTVIDDLGIDSNYMNIACKPDITLTASGGNGVVYQWVDQNGTIISNDSSVLVGVGSYVVSASSAGCSLYSDTLRVISVSDSLPPTNLNCIWERDGDVYFDWEHPLGASNTTIYNIMGSENLSGPYSLVASVDYPNHFYDQPSLSIASNIQFYYITTASTCAQDIISSDTLSSIAFDITQSNVLCWDDLNGYIAVDVHNTQLNPYSFYLDNILNANAYPLDSVWENLAAGTYVVKISDNANCVIEEEISITAPGFPLQALVSGNMSVCYGDTLGLAVGFGYGGTPDYSYEWFDASYTSFSLNDTAYGLSSGSYYLEVMDANGCDTFTSVQVISPQTSLSGNPQIFGVVCKGDSTGMLVGDAQGSWAPYQYYWLSSTGDTLQDSGVRLSRDTLFGLVSGSYDLHVYDDKRCFESYSLLVGEPTTKLSIDNMVVIETIACYGDNVGKARLYASGGMPNYAYLWDNGETDIIADELTSGYHSVMLSDDWGCEIEDSIYIPENPEIQSQISTIQNVSCYDSTNGIALITSSGGVPSYTYFWSNGQVGSSMPDTANGLLQGSYYVTTQDIFGCEVVDSIYISKPDPLSMEASELDWIDCYGDFTGLAYATALGGTMPYTFVWDNGQWIGDTINSLTPGLHEVIVTDARGCIASDTVFTHEPAELTVAIDDAQTVLAYCIGINTASLTGIASGGTPGYSYHWNDNIVAPQTTATANSLLAGVYTITVTDAKGCVVSDSRDIDTLQGATGTMYANTTSLIQYAGGNDVSCFGENDGKAMVAAFDAHAPYTYQWYGPNGFNSNNDSIDHLYAGTYSVTVRDTNNCMVNSSIIISEPDYIYFTTLGFLDESCLGACDGEIKIDITGGVESYTGVSTNNITGNVITSLLLNDSVVAGICSGSYTITVTDANDCPSSVINGGVNQQTIGTSVFTSANIDSLAINHVLCNGLATGSLQALNPNTTNPNYSYSWQNANNPGVIFSTATQVINLIAGSYVLYAHYADGNNLNQNYSGCTVTDTVTINELPILESVVSITDIDCYGANTGRLVSTQVSGGTSPYNLQWNPGSIMGSSINNLTVGPYTLTIIDANNCEEVDTFEVTEPQALTVNITQNGYVLTAVAPIGGTFPFSYSWRKQSNPNISIATGVAYTVTNYGTYYVRVTDSNGCMTESNSVLYVTPPSWDCITGQGCSDPGTGAGLYASQAACDAACGVSAIDETSTIALSIYPNPFKEETTVDFGRDVKQASLRVVDVFGKLIENYSVENTDKYVLKRENKSSGIYFVEIEVEQRGKVIYKLIIE